MNTKTKNLKDHCRVETIIECNQCPEMEGICKGPKSAAKYFSNKGWRFIKGKIYCPECVKEINSRLQTLTNTL